MKKLISIILSLIMLLTPLTSGAFSAFAAEVEPDCVKIMLIGNSYTYYNTLDQLLCKMGNAAGKDLLVVSVTKGGSDAYELLEEKLTYNAWYKGAKIKGGSGYMEDICSIDFGNINRNSSWDYIVLQNNDAASSTGMGDVYVLGLLSPMLKSNRNFIINSNYWVDSISKDRYREHLAVCKAAGSSIIDTRGFYSQYHNVFKNRVWFKDLTVRDSRNHPSVLGSYVFALSIYAKIFGTDELSSGVDDDTVLPFYNSDGGNIGEIVDTSYFKNKFNPDESINRKTASLIQSLVKNYAPYYIGSALVTDGKTLPEGELDEAVRYYDEQRISLEGFNTLGETEYYLNNGYIVTDGFYNIGGSTFYFDKYGERYSGWKTIDSNRYYMFENGSIAKGFTGISFNDGTFRTFYFNKKGVMLTGTHEIGGKTYLFSKGSDDKRKGEMYQSEWYTYVNSSGETVKKYYLSSGAMAKGLKTIKGKTYYFNDSGKLVKKSFIKVGKKYYYANKKGIIQKSKFVTAGGFRYYFNSKGVMVKSRFIKKGKYTYYADKSGALQKGWLVIKGNTYYFSKAKTKKRPKYAMYTGKNKIDGKKYSFSKSGALKPSKSKK